MTTRHWTSICLAAALSAGCQSMNTAGSQGAVRRQAKAPVEQKAAKAEPKEHAARQASFEEPVDDQPKSPKRSSGAKQTPTMTGKIFAPKDAPDPLSTKAQKRREQQRRRQQRPSLMESLFQPQADKSETMTDWVGRKRPGW